MLTSWQPGSKKTERDWEQHMSFPGIPPVTCFFNYVPLPNNAIIFSVL
jgi:hypothetical protein